MTGDALTVLTSTQGKCMTKRVTVQADGAWNVAGYDEGARWFEFEEIPVTDIENLYYQLAQLDRAHHSLIIRGAPSAAAREKDKVRRKSSDGTFIETPRRWAMIDIDKQPIPAHHDIVAAPEAAAEWMIQEYLPPEFHNVSCVWQLSSSAGIPGGSDAMSLHAWFWLDRPQGVEALKAFFGAGGHPIDLTVFRTVQPHYVAAPVFTNATDPVPRRIGLMEREYDHATLPDIDIVALKKVAKEKGAGWGLIEGAKTFEERLALMGDGEGQCGFHQPITLAIMAYVRAAGMVALDSEALKARIREQIAVAPKLPSRGSIEHYRSDAYLDTSIRGAIERRNNELIEIKSKTAKRISLEAAALCVESAVHAFLDAAEAWPQTNVALNLELPSLLAAAPVHAIAADAGVGKTTLVLRALAERIDLTTKRVHLFIPTHATGEEIVAKAGEMSIGNARRWSARTDGAGNMRYADDGTSMCHEDMLEIANEVEDAKVSVWDTVCQGCKHRESCGWARQHNDKGPGLVVMPVNYAFQGEERLPKADLQIFDEQLLDAAMTEIVPVKRNDLYQSQPPVRIEGKEKDDNYDLFTARNALHTATETVGENGEIALQALRDAGIDVDMAARAKAIEHQHADKLAARLKKLIAEDATPQQINNARKKFEYQEARRWAAVWRTIEQQIDLDRDRLYGVRMYDDAKGKKVIAVKRTIDVKAGAQDRRIATPTLLLDATFDEEIARRFFPNLSDVTRAEVEMPHVEVIQVSDTPVAKAKIAPDPDRDDDKTAKTKQNNLTKLARAVEVIAAGETEVGLISYKDTVEAMEARGDIPANVITGNFNGTRGQNRWENVSRMSVVGRTQPRETDMERQAEAIWATDSSVTITPGQYGDAQDSYEMADGTLTPLVRKAHPDSHVERVRWQTCEAELIQAIHRGRPVRRTADRPLLIVVGTNVPLPIPVTRLVTYEDFIPSRFAVMAARGVIFETATAAVVYPDLFKNAQAFRNAKRREQGVSSPYEYSLLGGRHTLPFVFQGEGERQQKHRARYIPALVPDVEAWLRARIPTPLVRVVVEAAPSPPDDLVEWQSGTMPRTVVAAVVNAQRSCAISQEELASRCGVSRPHLANALQGRFGLAEAAVARIKAFLDDPPMVQPNLI